MLSYCGYRRQRQVILKDITIVATFNCLQTPVATVFLISVPFWRLLSLYYYYYHCRQPTRAY
jgi:hypothetical protein